MSQSGFTNTFILEANRLSSQEVKGGNKTNNALFTNKVSDGLRLDTGDVVSVHSAYISELGAEGSDIQIKGVDIDTLNASQVLYYNEIRNNSDEGEIVLLRKRTDIVNGFPLSRRVNTSAVINYRDDTINLVMNPYKNANGEFYIPLPYNYSMPNHGGTSGIPDDILAWNSANPIIPNIGANTSNVFGNASFGNITKFPLVVCYNNDDKKSYNPTPNNASFNFCNRHDNSRYSLYQLRECIHLYPKASGSTDYTDVRDACLEEIEESNASFTNASYQYGLRADGKSGNPYWRDIATFPYERVKNRVNCSVNAGYNSNTDIASKITEDLIRTQIIDIKKFDGDVITTTAENQVNKTYNCANIGTYSYDAWAYFNQIPSYTNGTTGEPYIYRYIEAHNTIGVKRPELYDLGRELMGNKPQGYELRFDFYTTGAGGSQSASNVGGLLYTDIPWSKVEDLKRLVDAQRLYPELFTVSNINGSKLNFNEAFLQPNSSQSFFLHINTTEEHKYLGYDLNDNNSSYWGQYLSFQDYNRTPSYKLPSVPIFFDINSNTDGIAEGSVATGQDWNSAVYGFAVKTYDAFNDKYFIALRSSNHVNKYDIEIDANYNRYVNGTKIGWDRHFNAYGCPCMILWNGFCGYTGAAYEGMGISSYVNEDAGAGEVNVKYIPDKINNIYVGSQNIVMGFDPDSDRFEIRNLHTSERIGNLYNAGYTGDDKYEESNASGIIVFSNPDLAVPVNPNADNDVYKLNKQLLRTNFTPAMSPYNTETNASFFTSYRSVHNSCYTAKQNIEYFNNNFEKNAIYDSQCGNYIIDWGMNEKYWDESLLGIMGFRYSQTLGSGNSQTRVINSVRWGDSFDGMNENTTNADITNSDFHDLPRNMFNTPIFSLHPPVPQTPRFEDTANASHTYLPPVSITQDIGQPLRAENIPARTLRPYYTIRSNIVGQSRYLGSGDSSIPLPVVAVVEKVSQSGDFFNLTGSDMSFTITQPTTLSDITTSIHDPDGSYSRLSPNSAVLYKIQKQVIADMNPVSTILQGLKKKQGEQFEESLGAPQPTQKDIINLVAEMIVKNN